MIRVLYDYQAFIQRVGGVSRYSSELICNLSCEFKAVLPRIFSDNIFINEKSLPHFKFLPHNKEAWKYNVYKALNMTQSLAYLKFADYDIFHPLFIRPYFIGHVDKPVVVTVHDLNHDRFPSMLPKAETVQHMERVSCERADAVIAISEETKLDLIKYHQIPEKKIHVIYHGSDQNLFINNRPRVHSKDYILYIGGRGGYKNFQTFLKAFSLLHEDIDLICTGIPFCQNELETIHVLGLEKRVFQKFVSDEELCSLLANAVMFVYPSLGEGFGLPILEAFRCQCPCVISDLMCFHEVAGDAAVYFSPLNVEEMAWAIEKVIADSSLQQAMRSKGVEQMKKFTWERTVSKTEAVYRSLI